MADPDQSLRDAFEIWRHRRLDDAHYSADTLIVCTPATTISGLLIKARVAERHVRSSPAGTELEDLDWHERAVAELVLNLESLRTATAK